MQTQQVYSIIITHLICLPQNKIYFVNVAELNPGIKTIIFQNDRFYKIPRFVNYR